ncbi:hypothetical protein [Leisingera caerulea]|uniref:Uncharacterized protein n=1 Tax=Leisingera caerulea TaxID=506591 RepID=A0A9Q9HKS2_LEICA|nr:hypothetical protein [Leisingera caerulea]UWQ55922.1 hypothetical protein K3721_18985 [Leisingera caerulea]
MTSDSPSKNIDTISDQADLWAMWNGFENADELKEWGENSERERLVEQASQKELIAQERLGHPRKGS